MYMKEDNDQSIELRKAQSLVLNACSSLSGEKVSLAESLGRFPVKALVALEPLPGYDQSLRDGYAIAEAGPAKTADSPHTFQIVDEVAAGDTRKLVLRPGEAIRVMTGGLLPAHCVSVVPQESCSVVGDILNAPLSKKKCFIHAKGSELVKGQVVVSKGDPISPEQMILLAGVGYGDVEVVRKPGVSFFCTGSELVAGSDEIRAGKKFSANNPLLQSLIARAGAEFQDQQTVVDDPDTVTETMLKMAQTGCDIMISTGGMGPGKFDLIEETFCRAGGKVIYRSIHLRPGKSTLFGILGNTLFFGMPGPPPAVYLLFNELIRPAILKLQGAKQSRTKKLKVCLTEDLFFSKRGLPRLKGGMLSLEDGKCLVRQAGRMEAANCYIYCPATRRQMRTGELVTVHLL